MRVNRAALVVALTTLGVIGIVVPAGASTTDYGSTVANDGPIATWRFDGSAGTPKTQRDQGPSNAGSWTAEAWVDPTNSAGGDVLDLGTDHGFAISVTGDTLTSTVTLTGPAVGFSASGRNGAPRHTVTHSAGTILAGTWSHVVVTYDGATHSQRHYVNGELAGEWTDSGMIVMPKVTDHDGQVDHGRDKKHSAFHGRVDWVAVYRGQLWASHIHDHYQRGCHSSHDPGPPPPVLPEAPSPLLLLGVAGVFGAGVLTKQRRRVSTA
jgi:hypothetical protein